MLYSTMNLKTLVQVHTLAVPICICSDPWTLQSSSIRSLVSIRSLILSSTLTRANSNQGYKTQPIL
jgi:hypothetical protein